MLGMCPVRNYSANLKRLELYFSKSPSLYDSTLELDSPLDKKLTWDLECRKIYNLWRPSMPLLVLFLLSLSLSLHSHFWVCGPIAALGLLADHWCDSMETEATKTSSHRTLYSTLLFIVLLWWWLCLTSEIKSRLGFPSLALPSFLFTSQLPSTLVRGVKHLAIWTKSAIKYYR